LENGNAEIKTQVINCFWNLASAPGGKDILRGRGCIEAIVDLLSTDEAHGEMLMNMLGTLCLMAHRNIPNQETIRKLVKIEDLLNFLVNEDIDVRFLTAALLSKHAAVSAIEMQECQLKLANNDVVTCARPCDALAVFASSLTETDIISKDIVWLTPVVMLLSDEDINIELRRKVTSVLMKLTEENNNADIIRELGGVTVMIKMLSNTDIEVHSNASKALASLMRNEINRQIVVESGVFVQQSVS
jgi:hypothetical protein